jgi:predicted RND superfamily exporter protein
LRRLLTVLLPLSVMVSLSLGLMVLFDMRVNLYNMLVFPLAFGIGVDGAVYVTWALESDEPGARLLTATRAVLGSTLTSVAGFGSLMVSDNPGVASIGSLASLMLLVALGACLLFLPALHVARGRHL